VALQKARLRNRAFYKANNFINRFGEEI